MLTLLALTACARADVIISEVMTSNAVFINGRHDDWVELYNNGSSQASLSGWYLSNDPYSPRRWAFPDGTVIPKGGYLIVYCAGSETVTDGQKNALYASFKLSAKGDSVCLTDPEGNTATCGSAGCIYWAAACMCAACRTGSERPLPISAWRKLKGS